MSFSKLTAPCKFCNSRNAIYTCPRCNAKYCSMDCFKTAEHVQCSEAFFQEWVISSLRNMPETNERKSEMMEILKRVAQEDLEEEDENSIDARFADLNLQGDVDETVIWERLTEEEKKKFKALLENEKELSEILPDIQPWWSALKIKHVKDDSDSEIVDHPPLPSGVKSLSSLTSKSPSEYVRYNMINLLYVYAFLFRLYHGDLREFLEDCVDSIFQLCPVLSKNKNYLSIEEAIQDSIRLITSAYSDIPMTAVKNLNNDVISIITGPENANPYSYVFCCLNDMKLLFLELASVFKTSGNKSSKKMLMLVAKKMDFMLSWTTSYFSESLQPLAEKLQLMFLSDTIEDECHVIDDSDVLRETESVKATKIMIEEIN